MHGISFLLVHHSLYTLTFIHCNAVGKYSNSHKVEGLFDVSDCILERSLCLNQVFMESFMDI